MLDFQRISKSPYWGLRPQHDDVQNVYHNWEQNWFITLQWNITEAFEGAGEIPLLFWKLWRTIVKDNSMKCNDHSYFCNFNCRYFPCHQVSNSEFFNCLFCYCPLYALGENCGGAFSYTTQGIKDCSNCLIPHTEQGYQHISSRIIKVVQLIQRQGSSDESCQNPVE